MNGHSGNGAGRKPGDWRSIAVGRGRIERTMRTSRGVTNVPAIGEVGSAAYRRRLASQNRRQDPRRVAA